MRSLKIAVNIYYKPVKRLVDFLFQNKDIFIPINGGSSLRNDEWAERECIFDDSGENISSKNGLLNEMTSIYWVWKNYNNVGSPDYIGFNHYRRFFKKSDFSDYEDFDLIVSKPIFSSDRFSIAWQYRYYHVIDDLQKCVDVIREDTQKLGDEFAEYLNTNGINYAPCNMFIMKKDLFFEWCSFIFPLLSKLENRIDVSGRDNYQKRALCFLTERMFGFWCYRRFGELKIKQIDIDEHLDFKPDRRNERGDFS